MHPVDLASLTGTLTRCTATLQSLTDPMPYRAVQDYWLTSRFRHESWTRQLAAHRHAIQESGVSFRSGRWHEILPVMQEVLLSEPLTRILAYHARVLDERRQNEETVGRQDLDSEFCTLAQSTLAAHQEARHRCLHLIVFGPGLSVEQAVRLNRLRRTMEDYTDQLLVVMHPVSDLEEFAFDPQFVERSQATLRSARRNATSLKLHLSAAAYWLWKNVQADIDWRIASARLNYKLSQSVLAMLPTSLFDSFGVTKSRHQLSFSKLSPESSGRTNDICSPLAYPLNALFSKQRSIDNSFNSKPRW